MAEREADAREPQLRSDGFSEERKRLFLVALRNGESVLDACALVGVSNRTVYNHRRRDSAFARDWRLARQMAILPLELAAFERGVTGVEEPVYRYGKLNHTRVRRSDPLLKMLVVAENPKKYGRHAGSKTERKRLEKRVAARVAEEVAPLREALDAALAEVEALKARMAETAPPQIVNFMNPRARRARPAHALARRGEGATARGRKDRGQASGAVEISSFSRSS